MLIFQIQTVAEIERELDTAIYPGTEIMVDLPSHHFVKSSGAGVLVPQPSDDKHDPLVGIHSTAWKKHI